jgi:hypothetical protein
MDNILMDNILMDNILMDNILMDNILIRWDNILIKWDNILIRWDFNHNSKDYILWDNNNLWDQILRYHQWFKQMLLILWMYLQKCQI